MLTLYGCKGCGSVVVEALLTLCGETFSSVRWDWDDAAAWSRFAALSPQRQVPTVVFEDGTMMTESVAIVLWLMQRYPESLLLPEGDMARAQMLRWLVYLSVNVYGPVGIGDFPERWVGADAAAQGALKAGARTRAEASWSHFEASLAGSTYLLGDRMSWLDVYSAMMSRWRPGRQWIKSHCPKVAAAALATEKDPVVAAIFTENFGALS